MNKLQCLTLLMALADATIAMAQEQGLPGIRPAMIAGSCNNAASGFCNEFTGSSYKAASVQRACERQKMMFLAGACPTEGRVGSCLTSKGKSTESRYLYYAAFPGFGITPRGGAATAAESQCTKLKGEWTPN